MDSTDDRTVRVIVEVIAVLAGIVWLLIWRDGRSIRPGKQGILLRNRAIVFLSYAANVALMSLVILSGLMQTGRGIAIWRMATRVHAALAVLIVGLDVLCNEWPGVRGCVG